MADHPYVLSPSKLKKFLEHIQTAGVPTKVTNRYLESAGFKSKNDRKLIATLKSLGLLDSQGAPTPDWQHYRSKTNGPKVLAGAVKRTYADLFSLYPDAHRKDTEALRHFFSTHSKAGDRVLSAMVATFQAVCDMADFTGVSQPAPAQAPTLAPTATEVRDPVATTTVVRSGDGVTINVNIEIGVPPSTDPDVYDQFFAALKKHILT